MLKYLSLFALLLVPLPLAYGQDTGLFNSTINTLELYLEPPNSVNAFYLFFMLISIPLLTVYGMSNPKANDPTRFLYVVASSIMCILVALLLLSPLEFTVEQTHSEIRIIQNGTDDIIHTEVMRSGDQIVIVSAQNELRLALSAFFFLFALLNGLLAVLLNTAVFKR